jgi:hypothetical protein
VQLLGPAEREADHGDGFVVGPVGRAAVPLLVARVRVLEGQSLDERRRCRQVRHVGVPRGEAERLGGLEEPVGVFRRSRAVGQQVPEVDGGDRALDDRAGWRGDRVPYRPQHGALGGRQVDGPAAPHPVEVLQRRPLGQVLGGGVVEGGADVELLPGEHLSCRRPVGELDGEGSRAPRVR